MAHITVPEDSNNGRSETVVGSTPQDEFPFTYPYFSDDDIKVYIDGVVETGFTVTGTGSAVDGGYSSGKVTLNTPVSDVTVVTEREIALSREEDFPYPSSTLNIKALNTALDRFIAIFQQFRRKLTRTLRQPVGDVDELEDLPPAASRAGQVFVWDEDGQPSVGGSAFPGTITVDYIPVGNAAGDGYDMTAPTDLRTLIAAQPVDSDLTAIALLTTTAFGRALLELADAAALRAVAGLGTAATQNTGAFDAAGSAAAAQAASQPVDSDLTAIAALTTTSFGRSLLEAADAAALRTLAAAGTIATQNANNVAVTGGAIDGTPIGATSKAAGGFTTLTSTGNTTLGDAAGDSLTVNGKTYSKPNIPAFLAHNSSDDSNVTGNSVVATVDFDTEVFDQGGDFASDTFTAPTTGRYLLTARVTLDGVTPTNTDARLIIVTSNRSYWKLFNPGAMEASSSFGLLTVDMAIVADMDAADTATVTIEVRQGTQVVSVKGSAAGEYTTFSGVQVA